MLKRRANRRVFFLNFKFTHYNETSLTNVARNHTKRARQTPIGRWREPFAARACFPLSNPAV